MKILLLILLMSYDFIANAQGIDETLSDSILTKDNTIGLFVSPMFSSNQFANTWATFVGVGIGLNFNNKFEFNVSYFINVDEFYRQIIFPGSHKYDQTNIGFQAQYMFLDTKIKPLAGIGVQYTEASWNPSNDSNDTFVDHFINYNVFVGFNWEINKTFSFQANAGYMISGDVALSGLEPNDYKGLKGDVLLKIRLLNLRR